MKRLWMYFLLVATFSFIVGGIASRSMVPVSKLIRNWYPKLAKAKYDCNDFDYGLPGGGMRTFYCYVKSFLPYEQFTALVPVKIFLSGSHSAEKLQLDEEVSFGRYNPVFVQWLERNAVPAAEDKAFRDLTRDIYKAQIKHLARIYAATYVKLQQNKAFLEELKQKVQIQLSGGKRFAYDENHFFFMNPQFMQHRDNVEWFFKNGFDGGYSGNITKTAVAWWVRREIDGTAASFYRVLQKLQNAYER